MTNEHNFCIDSLIAFFINYCLQHAFFCNKCIYTYSRLQCLLRLSKKAKTEVCCNWPSRRLNVSAHKCLCIKGWRINIMFPTLGTYSQKVIVLDCFQVRYVHSTSYSETSKNWLNSFKRYLILKITTFSPILWSLVHEKLWAYFEERIRYCRRSRDRS